MHACHCTDCQRHTGSAFGLVVAMPEARFHLTGTPKLVQYPFRDRALVRLVYRHGLRASEAVVIE
jgi:hypothetical protein